jgi:hypothetical protein
MKRLLLALGAACLFTAFGPVPVVSAHWWWHHHSKSANAAANAEANPAPKKAKPQKAHKEKHHHQSMNKPEHLYNSPKSVGWWHKTPGPMGAGSNQK